MAPIHAHASIASEDAQNDSIGQPMLRHSRRNAWVPSKWPGAFALLRTRIAAIQQTWGSKSVAWLASEPLSPSQTTELAALQRIGLTFSRCGVLSGTISARLGDPETTVFEGSSASSSTGEGSKPDVALLLGSAPAPTGPEVLRRLLSGKRRARIILVNSDAPPEPAPGVEHIQIARGSERALALGMANILLASGWTAKTFQADSTEAFEIFEEEIAHFTTDKTCEETGIDADELWQLAQAVAPGLRTAFHWVGATHNTDCRAAALAFKSLAVLTGNYEQAPMPCILAECSWPAAELITELILSGGVRALHLISGGGGAFPTGLLTPQVLGRLDFLSIQSSADVSTAAEHADLILPTLKEGMHFVMQPVLDGGRRLLQA